MTKPFLIRKSNCNLPQEHQDGIKRLCDDFALWAEKCCKIRDDEGNLIPLVLNPVQVRFAEFCAKQWLEEKRIRVVVVKGRQQGLSTVSSAFIFHQIMQNEGKKCGIGANNKGTCEAILDMYRRIWDGLPEALRPVTQYRSKSQLSFPELGSSIVTGTAGGEAMFRGHTMHYCHLTEVSYWPIANAQDNMDGIANSIPKHDSIFIVESTANGMSGPYYNTYRNALKRTNGFRVFFSAWFETPKYAMDAPDDWEMSYSEMEYQKRYNLTREQMYWRHEKIGSSGLQKFEVDFPATHDEAFKNTGSNVFPVTQIDQMEDTARPLLARYRVNLVDRKLDEVPNGELSVYLKTHKAARYTIGVDTSEGLSDGDFSCAQVLDGDGKQVACWNGRIEPHLFGEVVDFLGRYYNNARLVVERNMHGGSVLWMLNSQLAYPNIYNEPREMDIFSKETQRLGVYMGSVVKPKAIDGLRAAVREKTIQLNDKQTFEELRSYISMANGKMSAAKGGFDDRVMALSLAVYALDRSYETFDTEPFRSEDVYWTYFDGVNTDNNSNFAPLVADGPYYDGVGDFGGLL